MTEFIQIPDKTEYTTRLGDLDGKGASADVRLSSLYNINISKWNDEAWCNLNFRDLSISREITTLDKGLIEVVKGDMKFQSWVLNKGVLEYCVGFAAVPTKFELEFDIIDSGNLDYWFQDTLTQEEVDEGSYRPPNVCGSYAVYFNKSHNKYKSGKFKHLYRWDVTDAEGKKAWCEPLRIEGGKLTIGLPVDFMRAAKYPVFAMGAGDTFGLMTEGGAEYGANSLRGSEAILTEQGTITKWTAYVTKYVVGTDMNMKLTYYNDDAGTPNARQVAIVEELVQGLYEGEVDFDITDTLESAATLYPGWCCDNTSLKVHYDATGGYNMWYDTGSGYDCPDPFVEDSSVATRRFTVYGTYTPAAGGLSIPRPLSRPFSGPLGGI